MYASSHMEQNHCHKSNISKWMNFNLFSAYSQMYINIYYLYINLKFYCGIFKLLYFNTLRPHLKVRTGNSHVKIQGITFRSEPEKKLSTMNRIRRTELQLKHSTPLVLGKAALCGRMMKTVFPWGRRAFRIILLADRQTKMTENLQSLMREKHTWQEVEAWCSSSAVCRWASVLLRETHCPSLYPSLPALLHLLMTFMLTKSGVLGWSRVALIWVIYYNDAVFLLFAPSPSVCLFY